MALPATARRRLQRDAEQAYRDATYRDARAADDTAAAAGNARLRAQSMQSHKPRYRITTGKAVLMIVIAGIFDLIQLGAKLFILMGLAAVGALAGSALGSFVGLTETGAAVGGAIGGLLQLTGIGTVVSIHIGMLLSWIFSLMAALCGYIILSFLFTMNNVQIFGGEKAGEKVGWFIVTVVISITPLLNILPALTGWTIRMIAISRYSDRTKAQRENRLGAAAYRRMTRLRATAR